MPQAVHVHVHAAVVHLPIVAQTCLLLKHQYALSCQPALHKYVHTHKPGFIVRNVRRSLFTLCNLVFEQQPDVVQALCLSCVHPVLLPSGKTCTQLWLLQSPSFLRLCASRFSFNNCNSKGVVTCCALKKLHVGVRLQSALLPAAHTHHVGFPSLFHPTTALLLLQ